MVHTSNSFRPDALNLDKLSEDEYYRLLASERRRHAIVTLQGRSMTIGLEEVASDVASRAIESGDPSQGTIQNVAVSLHHVHFPLMEEMDILEYDHQTNRVVDIGL